MASRPPPVHENTTAPTTKTRSKTAENTEAKPPTADERDNNIDPTPPPTGQPQHPRDQASTAKARATDPKAQTAPTGKAKTPRDAIIAR
ncbi:hypothetical protein SAMN02745178_00014 [Gemmiger formicilis]|uniref:Uncharacterized protein n=1 Tax=Gemmiger formicilis TaxID=745368 RepID=A0A1T4W6E1_9FIRM|nr:hypothetical protein SAMN02745178_00014 [Gemmiger formicilis]